jgi:hypothetical protein
MKHCNGTNLSQIKGDLRLVRLKIKSCGGGPSVEEARNAAAKNNNTTVTSSATKIHSDAVNVKKKEPEVIQGCIIEEINSDDESSEDEAPVEVKVVSGMMLVFTKNIFI